MKKEDKNNDGYIRRVRCGGGGDRGYRSKRRKFANNNNNMGKRIANANPEDGCILD